jgi:hypothetical protein
MVSESEANDEVIERGGVCVSLLLLLMIPAEFGEEECFLRTTLVLAILAQCPGAATSVHGARFATTIIGDTETADFLRAKS